MAESDGQRQHLNWQNDLRGGCQLLVLMLGDVACNLQTLLSLLGNVGTCVATVIAAACTIVGCCRVIN